MAFSNDDKYRIIFALCHHGKILIEDSTHYNSIINDRMERTSPQIEERALALVSKIEDMKEDFANSPTQDKVSQIDDISFDTNRSLEIRRAELKRLLSELSNLLDIPNACSIGGGGMMNLGM